MPTDIIIQFLGSSAVKVRSKPGMPSLSVGGPEAPGGRLFLREARAAESSHSSPVIGGLDAKSSDGRHDADLKARSGGLPSAMCRAGPVGHNKNRLLLVITQKLLLLD